MQRSCDGRGGGRSALLGVAMSWKKGARSARVGTRGQDPLVIHSWPITVRNSAAFFVFFVGDIVSRDGHFSRFYKIQTVLYFLTEHRNFLYILIK
jgi:hypothetical protein